MKATPASTATPSHVAPVSNLYRVWDSRRPALDTPIVTDFCTFSSARR